MQYSQWNIYIYRTHPYNFCGGGGLKKSLLIITFLQFAAILGLFYDTASLHHKQADNLDLSGGTNRWGGGGSRLTNILDQPPIM